VGLCLFVCLFAHSSITDIPICTKLAMLIPWNQKERSSILGEGVSCSSETNHDIRMAPRPKLFVSKRLHKQRPKPRKIVLGSIPSKDGFCSSDTTHDRRTAPGPKLFVSKRRLQKQMPKNRKVSGVWVLTRKFSVARKPSTREERRQGKICSFQRGDYRN
jgi:hypothetical protein